MSQSRRHWRLIFSFLLVVQFSLPVPAPALEVAPARVFRMLPSPTAAFYKSLRSMTISTAKSFARYHIATTYGWGARQFACLDDLWTGESHWNFRARNGSSGAYGIPQALPGNKMSIAGNDWRTNPVTQIAWGTRYIKIRYSSPCSALNYEYRNGSY